jgi:hypothetical protein
MLYLLGLFAVVLRLGIDITGTVVVNVVFT